MKRIRMPARDHAAVPGIIGVAIVLVLAALSCAAPWLAAHGYGDPVGDAWDLPGWPTPLGYDNLGRDMLSRLLYGGRITLGIALAATALACFAGATLGLVAAASGRWVDTVLARANDTVMAMPPLIFAMVALTILGTSIPVLVAVLATTGATRVFRLARGLAGDIAALDYFEVALLRRESLPWLVFREMLPNMAAPLATEFGLRLSSTLLLMAALSFLGLGVQPPLADWGTMVRENAGAIAFGEPAPLFPAAALSLFIVGVNFATDWALLRQQRAQGRS